MRACTPDDERKQQLIDIFSDEPFHIDKFNDRALILYDRALTHSSYANEKKDIGYDCRDNERLEFLGNYVLDYLISDYLYHHFPDFQPKSLNDGIKLTKNLNLARIAKGRQLAFIEDDAIRRSTELTNNIIADAFEAVIGALYLHKGMKYTKTIVLDIFRDDIYEKFGK
jgi:ribonuclease-3